MDESSAFLLTALAFFLTIAVLCISIESIRESREDRREVRRESNRIAEQREFGYAPVQQAREASQSFRRYIK